MIVAAQYNHLNAYEYLLVNRKTQLDEIIDAIKSVDANKYLKISCDVTKIGQVFYAQAEINKALKAEFKSRTWEDNNKVYYYVTRDLDATRDIINLDKKDQEKELIRRGLTYYNTNNEVDFKKDEIAVEVQFGKYFSVAYDLHVKHTFFYSRNDINVGVEIIPTKPLEQHMDTGVPYFENEVTNVVREGRTNPPVPIYILGIEPENMINTDPLSYSDADYKKILLASDIGKLKTKVDKIRRGETSTNPATVKDILDKIDRCMP